MIQLRLFRTDQPFQQIDERLLSEGRLVIGRDASADWVIDDDTCEVSRRHCVISLEQGKAVVQDTSANGVFIGDERRRLAGHTSCALSAYATMQIGKFLIVVEPAEQSVANDVENALATQAHEALNVRTEWADFAAPSLAEAPPNAWTDAAMLEAFCSGAGLDASSFAGEEPAEVLRRAGAIYKQTILGLSDLLSERHAFKSDLEMVRTTISSSDNNPFKWAPTRRVAIDLLRDRNDGFLSGPLALKASFEDVRKHALGLLAGARASLDAALEHLAPCVLEEQAKVHATLFGGKADACWRVFVAQHARLAGATDADQPLSLDGAFKAGYERRVGELATLGTRS